MIFDAEVNNFRVSDLKMYINVGQEFLDKWELDKSIVFEATYDGYREGRVNMTYYSKGETITPFDGMTTIEILQKLVKEG